MIIVLYVPKDPGERLELKAHGDYLGYAQSPDQSTGQKAGIFLIQEKARHKGREEYLQSQVNMLWKALPWVEGPEQARR